ncbi:host specificity factor TipJ family phage tail protein [Methylobacterium dankookense]|uniref:Tip attachment protein J domain-containing protein n=1 Tax=Methylobacterium dankookense TaxID=560405 RepID=A0A564G480_9HYPH|nr:host specificity factor TipJ family phage tail protein [Methylobacterium dankookense]GJD58156.1 hypothetical protein IFDJLNFL_4071 [Methylobacterium dankookense]VUF15107.1 hypothetical protein MTDSW087_04840 [Methylobacterium dankookense]
MTLIVTANIAGQARGEPVRLPDRRRRRLSTIVARHRPPPGRRFVVSVHRRGEQFVRPCDRSVRLRAAWRRTLVGPHDVVLITVVPLGRGIASIGLAIASIALIAIAPYAAPAIAAGLTGAGLAVSAGVVQAGLVVGGIALSFAAQASAAAKKKTDRELYSVTGGGNLPKPGARRPLIYGRCWSSPPLSQKDYFHYDGDSMVLVKRMTLGIGKFQIHAVRVGEAAFWDEEGGYQAPFTATGGPLGTQIEFLYEQPSTISPGDAITSPSVGGQEFPRPGGNPEWTPWFSLTPPGVTADAAQMAWTYPQIYRVSSAGRQVGTVAGVVFQGQEIDPNTGDPIGPEFEMWRSSEGTNALTTSPLRRGAYFRLPKDARYRVRGQNMYQDAVGFDQKNTASWDGMTAFKDDTRVRPATTEIVMRVRAGKGLTVTAFSEIWVDATRIVPVWTGAAWVEQPTSKAVWAFADLVRAEHGLALPSGFDADKARYYANLLAANDTFDGVLPEVASFWEAAGEILLPLRADPVKIGPTHSFVRDESRAEPRHVLTRRQIVRDSTGATFKTKVEGGDVIVEFDRDGDPARPDEARFSYGPPTRTPKRYRVNGIRDGLHALKHATWLAAVAVFRGNERKITTEWDGRLVVPGDHILSDLWYLEGKQTFGVASASGNLLQLDTAADLSAEWGYGSVRTRQGREWGILRMRGAGPRGLELHAADVAALAGQTGISLSAVLARDTQDPTTVVLGDLVELQETYVARAALPSDADHVQIEMVADDPRVWQLLDEQVIAPAPVNTDPLAEPLVPQIAVLHARCQRVETGIEVVWGVSTTRGARAYEAEISYDAGQSWDTLSALSPASSGRAQMRQSDQPVTVRARAYGRTGLPGNWIQTTFTTVAPLVDGDQTEIVRLPPIDYAGLTADVQARIAHILDVEAEANAKAADLLARVLAAAAVGDANTASIISESQTRLQGDQALASDLSAVVVRVGDTEAAVATERTARIDGDSAQATRTDLLIVQTNNDRAYFLSTTNALIDGDQALSTRLDALSATVGSNTAAIISEQQARADGDSVQASRTDALIAQTNSDRAYLLSSTQALADAAGASASQITDLYARSDAGTAVGRFSMQVASGPAGVTARIQALIAATRGGQTYGASYYLDLLDNGQTRFVVDANAFYITSGGSPVPMLSFDGFTLTIPSLRVTNSVMLPNSVSQSGWDFTTNSTISFTVNARANSRISVTAQFDGAPQIGRPIGSAGRFQISRDGTIIRDVPINFYIAGNNENLGAYTLETTAFVVDIPGAGSHTYTITHTGNQGPISYKYEELAA